MPCIFSMSVFYVAILFWCKFNETIAPVTILGTFLIVPCVAFLSLGAADSGSQGGENDVGTYSEKDMQLFAILAVAFGMLAPAFWTVKILYLRLSEEQFKFNLFDLAVDGILFQNVVATFIYLAYVNKNGFDASELLQGSITAVFFIIGDVTRSMAFRYGPGGPINALVGTMVVYQTLVNAFYFD